MDRPITRALLSVSNKTGLVAFARFLDEQGVELLSTGGTAKALRDEGLPVIDVSSHTGFPEIMDGRVKTLHPKIHGGLRAKRADANLQKAMAEHGIGPIDLVVVNLYPFEQTVARGAAPEECIENIDIGGPSMIRSSAKNHEDVTVVVDPGDYEMVMQEMQAGRGATTLPLRRRLAGKAFARTSAYDAAITAWFAGGENFPETFALQAALRQPLRYGENPHQQAAFYALPDAGPGVTTAKQLQGKELSYNNINDTDAAFELVAEFSEPAIVLVKHANPCGVAIGATAVEAYQKALACDPVSAYGGILAANRPLDAGLVEAIGSLFLEVIIAPSAEQEALRLLEKKKNLRVLLTGSMPKNEKALALKSVAGGLLVQDKDIGKVTKADCRQASKKAPSAQEWSDMLFAFTVAKHVKSNAIVLARGGSTVGIGAGQMSRVDAVRVACQKAADAKLMAEGSVLASDAFFPFDDNVHAAAKAGITAIIQPGGSIRDEDVIKTADSYGLAMVFTGQRHFRH